MNAKPDKMCRTTILHQSHDHLSEEMFLQLTPRRSLVLVGDSVAPVEHKPATSMADRSKEDWKTCCQCFESNPDSSLDTALANVNFLANRPNMNYYKEITLTKAREHVRKQVADRLPAEPASCSVPSAPRESLPVGIDADGLARMVQMCVDKALDKRLPGPVSQDFAIGGTEGRPFFC